LTLLLNHYKNELKESINLIPSNPMMYSQSRYFNNRNIRDMIYKGYTIIYRVRPIKKEIEIMRIFNKNKPL
jgi:plasmid stabilization system protein ParE